MGLLVEALTKRSFLKRKPTPHLLCSDLANRTGPLSSLRLKTFCWARPREHAQVFHFLPRPRPITTPTWCSISYLSAVSSLEKNAPLAHAAPPRLPRRWAAQTSDGSSVCARLPQGGRRALPTCFQCAALWEEAGQHPQGVRLHRYRRTVSGRQLPTGTTSLVWTSQMAGLRRPVCFTSGTPQEIPFPSSRKLCAPTLRDRSGCLPCANLIPGPNVFAYH